MVWPKGRPKPRTAFVTCERCHKTVPIPPSFAAGRRYCSRTCFERAQAVPIKPCDVCKKPIGAPARRRFCSIACSNVGRTNRLKRHVERDGRIVELARTGVRAPTIVAMLRAENPDWETTPVNVRAILHRAR